MRGYTRLPGLVPGEPCQVRVQRLGENVESLAIAIPPVVFDRDISGSVVVQGARNTDGVLEVTAVLSDPWLDGNTHVFLRHLHGREVPAPYRYEVTPLNYLRGWTREAEIHAGDACHIWIRPDGEVPWLEPEGERATRARYPETELVGFWKARVTAVTKARPNSPLRRLRAVFHDERILHHKNPLVRELYGHEPWTRYAATQHESELTAAGGEILDGASQAANAALARSPFPEWIRRARLNIDDFLG